MLDAIGNPITVAGRAQVIDASGQLLKRYPSPVTRWVEPARRRGRHEK
jgi:hypothetical protein